MKRKYDKATAEVVAEKFAARFAERIEDDREYLLTPEPDDGFDEEFTKEDAEESVAAFRTWLARHTPPGGPAPVSPLSRFVRGGREVLSVALARLEELASPEASVPSSLRAEARSAMRMADLRAASDDPAASLEVDGSNWSPHKFEPGDDRDEDDVQYLVWTGAEEDRPTETRVAARVDGVPVDAEVHDRRPGLLAVGLTRTGAVRLEVSTTEDGAILLDFRTGEAAPEGDRR